MPYQGTHRDLEQNNFKLPSLRRRSGVVPPRSLRSSSEKDERPQHDQGCVEKSYRKHVHCKPSHSKQIPSNVFQDQLAGRTLVVFVSSPFQSHQSGSVCPAASPRLCSTTTTHSTRIIQFISTNSTIAAMTSGALDARSTARGLGLRS